MDELSEPLKMAGITEQAALTFHTAVVSFTVGWLMFEQNERFNRFLGEMIDFNSGFDTGLRALAFGFQDQAMSSNPPLPRFEPN